MKQRTRLNTKRISCSIGAQKRLMRLKKRKMSGVHGDLKRLTKLKPMLNTKRTSYSTGVLIKQMTQKPRLKGRRMSGVHGDPRRPTKPNKRRMNGFLGDLKRLIKLKPMLNMRRTSYSTGVLIK